MIRSLALALTLIAAPAVAQGADPAAGTAPPETIEEPITVFAAASLKEPLDEIALRHPQVTVTYGGSGTLARQVMQGAPADLVFLAHPDWMEALAAEGALVEGSRTDLLSNALVLVGASETPDLDLTLASIVEALGVSGRLAIGLTTSVPAGIYAKQALTSLGLWEALEPRLAETDNVRAALALAARGEVPLAMVYATDARVEPTLKIVARIPEDSHAPILYQAAVVAGGAEDSATAFLADLQSEAARTAFLGAGFLPLDAQ
ncbi:molybdate ABC transporter substrate-binding protein [Salipiger sp. IMCC34102]|uniref:molybdate ABC transporter substrate-binding protein n=1 Tax=Salipiger sp. IMCC34102 TaxID=2510647 RepID=UPI00101D9F44|nr:molybdate ABC transporter substrate-binding protein [Salipiger sp. IMCC34102]RYH02227.1 molybdate ABC transporter substrate-binding protein [Salipiger sp. IMCC34102]